MTLLLIVISANVLFGSSLVDIIKQNWGNLCVLKQRNKNELNTCSNSGSWLSTSGLTAEQAITTLKKASDSRQHPIIQLRLGEHYFQKGYVPQALTIWRSIPDSALYFANQSVQWAEEGDLDKALAMADIVEALDKQPDPDKQLMYETLCRVWQIQGSFSNSLQWCKLHAEVVPNALALLTLTDAQIGLQQYDDALMTVEQIIHQTTDKQFSGRAYQKKAEIYKYRGQLQESAAMYQTAIEYGVSNRWLSMGFAQILLDIGDLKEACAYFKQAKAEGYQPSLAQTEQFSPCSTD